MPYYVAPWVQGIGRNGAPFFDTVAFDTPGARWLDVRADPASPGKCLLYSPIALADPSLVKIGDDPAETLAQASRDQFAALPGARTVTATTLKDVVRDIFSGGITGLPSLPATSPIIWGPTPIAPRVAGGGVGGKRVRDAGFNAEWAALQEFRLRHGHYPIAGGTQQDSDLFTGTDGTDLTTYNAKWVQLTNENPTTALVIKTNGVGSTNTGAERTKYTTAFSPGTNHYAQIAIVGTKATWGTGACVNCQTAAQSLYKFGYDANNDGTTDRWIKETAGVVSFLTAAGAVSPAVGDTLYAENQGGALKGIVSGGQSDTVNVSDSSFTGGQPGVQVFPNTLNQLNADNWIAGDFAAGGGPFPPWPGDSQPGVPLSPLLRM